jgi:hypothetical protein
MICVSMDRFVILGIKNNRAPLQSVITSGRYLSMCLAIGVSVTYLEFHFGGGGAGACAET